MIRGGRIIRNEQTLSVYVNRATVVLGVLVSTFCIVSGVVGVVHGSTEAMDVFSIAIGVASFLGALSLWFTSKPLLIVNSHGISSPLFNQVEVLEWNRIADVRVGVSYMQNSFTVDLWCDVDRPEAGTKLGLHIPSGGLPTRTKKLVAEALTYRPVDHRGPQ